MLPKVLHFEYNDDALYSTLEIMSILIYDHWHHDDDVVLILNITKIMTIMVIMMILIIMIIVIITVSVMGPMINASQSHNDVNPYM